MKKRKIAMTLVVIVLSVIIYFIGYYRGKSVPLGRSIRYYNQTEALLDTIYRQNQEYFEALMEADVYYYYEVAKDDLNK